MGLIALGSERSLERKKKTPLSQNGGGECCPQKAGREAEAAVVS